ncbi:MAG: CDP-diacylglycerol--glycerol-3-phosphate 3-phosphatidyltransferase [Candidatus Brocadiales bacterium]
MWPIHHLSGLPCTRAVHGLDGFCRSENLPNQLTILRLFMGLLFFLVLSIGFFDLALAVFVTAMSTDFLDGYLARRNGQISNFGRIVDPLADKLIICGGLSLLLFHLPLVKPWMVITIISRELLISLLRGYAELNGVTFPSNLWGKAKMTFQSLTVALLVFVTGHDQGYWTLTGVEGLLWFTVMLTVLSGLTYLFQAWQFLQTRPAPSGLTPSGRGLTGPALYPPQAGSGSVHLRRMSKKPYGVL